LIFGIYPLHKSIECKEPEIGEYLIINGANVNAITIQVDLEKME